MIKRSSQPLLHKRIHASVREAIFEELTNVNASESITECLAQFESLNKN
jgi:hypothetical protein